MESDIWKKKKDLRNAKELVDEFKGRLGVEVEKQEGMEKKQNVKLNPRADKFRRMELPGKYTVKML